MQFLHTVHCVASNNLHNRHWNWHLFCLFALALKKNVTRVEFGTCTQTTIY